MTMYDTIITLTDTAPDDDRFTVVMGTNFGDAYEVDAHIKSVFPHGGYELDSEGSGFYARVADWPLAVDILLTARRFAMLTLGYGDIGLEITEDAVALAKTKV